MLKFSDTIVAIATPLGESALAVVRLSGPQTEEIVRKVFRLGKALKKDYQLKERYVHYGFIVDPETEEIQDEVTLIFYREPRSYTTEDMAEILCHGGRISPRKVLSACLKAGARLAEPGEFTKRAFLGGRVDLTEAEAVLEVIHARAEKAHKAALNQLSGGLRKRIEKIAERLKEAMMLVEASIDFPEEEIEFLEPEELKNKLSSCIEDIKKLERHFGLSRQIKEGFPIAIVGRPNVGKSSLLNALLKEERAIVTDIPGTTRDTIEGEISIQGIPIRVIDTAGIRKTEDPVERIGVERSIEKLKEAAVVLVVLDASEGLQEEDLFIADLAKDKRHIVVLNKTDLPQKLRKEDVEKLGLKGPVVKTSAKKHTGIEKLQREILEQAGMAGEMPDEFIVNERHADALRKAREALERCKATIETGLSNEFIAIDLKEALDRLGEITGETTTDDILNMIFERFCIGK